MTIATTPNLSLPYPDGGEPVSGGPVDYQNIVQILDGGANGPTAMLYRKGILAARPAANTVPIGGVYDCTDVPALFHSDGTAWHFIAKDGGVAPIGSISGYVGSADPVDADGISRWAICNARALSRVTYVGLFNIIATTYGAGDGVTTFNLPDLRGRFPLGKATAGTGNSRGGTGGSMDHTHPLSDNGGAKVGQANDFNSLILNSASPSQQTFSGYRFSGTTNDSSVHTSIPATALNGATDGSNPPYLVINYVIRIL